jgi:hypothetical protein
MKNEMLLNCIREGIRLGIIALSAAGTFEFAKYGYEIYKHRTGASGGEILIIPMAALLIYTGWTARKDWIRYKIEKRRA